MPDMKLSNYFYGDEAMQFSYFRIPCQLITHPRFKHLSTDSKLLYGMLLDRMSLSIKNEWYDDTGRVYIYYTVDEMDLRNILDDKDLKPQKSETIAPPTSGTAPEPPGVATELPPIPASPDIPAASEIPVPKDAPTTTAPPQEKVEKDSTQEQAGGQPLSGAVDAVEQEKEENPFKGAQERAEVTKVILTGDRLRKYFPDVSMTPREIEESVYSALEERRLRQLKEQQKAAIFKRSGTPR